MKKLLYIEPKKPKSIVPTIDKYSEKLQRIMAKYTPPESYISYCPDYLKHHLTYGALKSDGTFDIGNTFLGTHECICGEQSYCCDILIAGDAFMESIVTNTLAYHYILYHREEVPIEELQIIETLKDVDPNDVFVPNKDIEKEKESRCIRDETGNCTGVKIPTMSKLEEYLWMKTSLPYRFVS
jgi:hypothetical protein